MSQTVPIVIAGPTAVGKSKVALEVARQLGGEIISVDSMQVYRGMDIGTAKPSDEERRFIPHHLVDVVNVGEAFDAARFARLARSAVEEIQARKRVAILVGGTGLYFRALIDGLGDAPPADPALRRELEATPLEHLLAELEQRDPSVHEHIDKRNARRVVRAIEVIRLTGRKFSEQRSDWKGKAVNATAFVMSRSMEDLRRRIEVRVDEMFNRGLVEETRALMAVGLADNQTAMQAIGYRQVAEYLDGKRSLAQTIDLVKVRTRQYAKRQLTWFRRHLDAEWLDIPPETEDGDSIKRIIEKVGRPAV